MDFNRPFLSAPSLFIVSNQGPPAIGLLLIDVMGTFRLLWCIDWYRLPAISPFTSCKGHGMASFEEYTATDKVYRAEDQVFGFVPMLLMSD